MASPWWVNLLILVPFVAGWAWRRGIRLSRGQLILLAVWAGAFGAMEGAVVVYLRAIMSLLNGFGADLSGVTEFSKTLFTKPEDLVSLPMSLYGVEILREAASIIILFAVSRLAVTGLRERWAAFLWSFAIWDIVYYAFLWLVIRWPSSFFAADVLFFLPVPWFSQVWFPILVSVLTLLAVIVSNEWKSTSSK